MSQALLKRTTTSRRTSVAGRGLVCLLTRTSGTTQRS